MNTQALDALAALCGSAPANPLSAAPCGSVAVAPYPGAPAQLGPNNNASSYALLSRQLRDVQAAAAAQQAQRSARQAALAPVAADLLQRTGLGGQRLAPLGLGCGAVGPSGDPLAAFAGLRADPSTDARAMLLKILLAQQQQQQQPQSLPSMTVHPPPAAPLATQRAPYVVNIDAPVRSPIAAMQIPQAAPAPATYSPPLMHHYPIRDETSPTHDMTSGPQPPPPPRRPPPKKRHIQDISQTVNSVLSQYEDKKLAKRTANRLSAQLSRKRKKSAFNDLKGENAELRRKEQILQSIPDLIVVFDASGRMPFVSRSVTELLDRTAEELEETAFWDHLTADSVQSIKSAFIDALAVKRPPTEDATPLCGGDALTVQFAKDEGGGARVSLKGVVHFAGESPECVCSIRPEDHRRVYASGERKKASSSNISTSTLSIASSVSLARSHHQLRSNEAAAVSFCHPISDAGSE